MPQLPDEPEPLSPQFPTNSFFRNLVINNGDGPVYIHPYTIRCHGDTLALSYENQEAEDDPIYHLSRDDLLISSFPNQNPFLKYRTFGPIRHSVSSFDDLSITLDLFSNLRFFLVRGSPFLTFAPITGTVRLHLSFYLPFSKVSCNDSHTKYTIKGEHKTWLLYSSLPIDLPINSEHNDSYWTVLTSDEFSGVIRIAMLTDSSNLCEAILDHFSSCYPVSGKAEIKRFRVEYKWEKRGEGGLLMLAHPLHVRLLSPEDYPVNCLEDFKYKSKDGELVGVVGDSWVLKINPDPIKWFSLAEGLKGLKKGSYGEIQNAISKDVETTCGKEISTKSPYLYGVLIARAARLAVIAAELGYSSVIPTVAQFLKKKIEPWLDGTYGGNGFWYDEKWDQIVFNEESIDFRRDPDSHYCTAYFLYVISVLSKIDPVWGWKYKLNAYTLMACFMKFNHARVQDNKEQDELQDNEEVDELQDTHINGISFDEGANSIYPRPRCFDLWTLHTWVRGLGDNADIIDLKNASEALKAYYSAILMGLVYEDTILFDMGSTLLALEICSAKNTLNSIIEDFKKLKMKMGLPHVMDQKILFNTAKGIMSSVRDNLLPLLPITEVLFSDVTLVEKLMDTLLVDKQLEHFPEAEVMAVVCALEATYDKEGALEKVKKLKQFDERNSLTNLLWWIHGRVNIPHHFRHSLTWPTSGCKEYKYKELQEATNRFRNTLGKGGFATVYKGVLRDRQEVAVKLLNSGGEDKDRDFWREVEIVSRIKHRCLVRFFGYCIYEQQRLLIYDYVPNNTLHDHLHGKCSGIMAWEKRVRVAFCVACGIEYLHHKCGDRIVHRDIKSNNILLDNEFNAQVADFGFAKSTSNERAVSTSRVAGTNGYFAPEYVMYEILTEKSDVYSFGIVLLELITGREPSAPNIEWARSLLKKPISNENIQMLVDPMLENKFDYREMIWMTEMATDCISYSASERPNMSEVVSAMRQHARISGMEPDNVEPDDVNVSRGIIFL